MAVKGERLPPELVERMRAGRVEALARKKAQQARRANESPPPINDLDLDLEDVSLPVTPPVMVEIEPEEAPAPAGDPTDPYNLYLATLDRETREMFSPKELRELFDDHWAQAQAEKKKRKKKEISEIALSTARSQMGLLPEQKLEALQVARQNKKPVVMLVQMPPAQDDGGPADIGLRVDGKLIANGTRHYCTYGEAASLREMLYRHGQHELLFKGQNLRYRAYLLGQAMGSVNTLIDTNERGGNR
jgi:hypothetical protein